MEGDLAISLFLDRTAEFQSTPSAWRETGDVRKVRHRVRDFNPLPPHGGRQQRYHLYTSQSFISIHSLRMEGDHKCAIIYTEVRDFNPLPPHGGRPSHLSSPATPSLFQSTPSAWRETSELIVAKTLGYVISIHSLRMEGDILCCISSCCRKSFQSTPSAWRETFLLQQSVIIAENFNPLPPHGGRQKIQREISG